MSSASLKVSAVPRTHHMDLNAEPTTGTCSFTSMTGQIAFKHPHPPEAYRGTVIGTWPQGHTTVAQFDSIWMVWKLVRAPRLRTTLITLTRPRSFLEISESPVVMGSMAIWTRSKYLQMLCRQAMSLIRILIQ